MIVMVVAATIIGALALIAGGVVGVAARTMIVVARRSRRWPAVPGRVVRSEIRDGRAVIRYAYAVEGAEYEGTDVTAGDWPYRRARTAAQRLQRYPVGTEVQVYYDPHRPTFAILKPGLSRDVLYLPVVASLLLLISFSSLSWSIWRVFS